MPQPSAEETAKAIELGHEPSTVSVKGLVWFFIIFFVFAVVVHTVVWVLYRGLVKYQEKQDVPKSALSSDVRFRENRPPEPRLQPTLHLHERTEWQDLALMHGRENQEFVNRGWINKETGDFQIPQDLIAKIGNGAPVTATPGPTSNPASGGTGAGMPR